MPREVGPEMEEGPQEGRKMLEGSKAAPNAKGRQDGPQNRKRFGEEIT